MTEMALRIGSAFLLAPLVLVIVWWGDPAFSLLVAAMAAVIVWEWSGITRTRRIDAATLTGAASVALCVLAASAGLLLTGLLLAIAGGCLAQVLAWRADRDRLMWLGALYAAVPGLALVVLRGDLEWGLFVILWLFLLVWATDIGAFFAGRLIGGAKLWPSVSPKKTWSGAIGGVSAALATGLAVLYFPALTPGLTWAHAGLIVALSVASQLGDLGESFLKRRFEVKDSSNLIPGHGGVMDRVDGLVAAAVVAALVGIARGGPQAAGGGVVVW